MKSHRDHRLAKLMWPNLSRRSLAGLAALNETHGLSLRDGDVTIIDGQWYVTHSGLLRTAMQRKCQGIDAQPVEEFCNRKTSCYAFRATVFTSSTCKGFVGYGDANPSNVSALVRGAEMRVAETRAVNRALRKAYGIGICSVEEIGSASVSPDVSRDSTNQQTSANQNGNQVGPKVRDRLCQLIRQHRLDANLVKSYAVDFCGTKTLREATREQVQAFVAHLADWAEKDRNALLCQLNSYLPPQRKQHGAA